MFLLPDIVAAQSQINGVIRDESGGVLPGVTVEASSPVLIEKVRSAVTDDQGRYNIIDLRPGIYRLTFTLTGFNTVVRDGVEVPGGVAVTANADLKVGALEETITVSGQTPLVDVTQATRTQVLTRDLIDALPSTRNIMSVGMMVPGIRLGTPDVGGSRQMEQTNPRGHGIAAKHTVQHIDGMSVNSQETSNQQSYVNDALSAEVTVSTSAHPAEIQSGGLRTNMIPKDGGNNVSGSIFFGGSDGNWQSNNVSDEMRAQNFTSANGIAHIQNFNASMGGPIWRDKLWFFVSARHISTDELVANVDEYVTAPDGELIRSTLDQYIRDVLGRVTWQVSQKNKFAVFFERTWKRKGKDFGFGSRPALRNAARSEQGALRRRAGQVHEHADQQDSVRGGLLELVSALDRLQPAGSAAGSLSRQRPDQPGVAEQRPARSERAVRHAALRLFVRLHRLGLERPGSADGRCGLPRRQLDVVCHRQPQLQGRVRRLVRPGPCVHRSAGRPGAAVHTTACLSRWWSTRRRTTGSATSTTTWASSRRIRGRSNG